MVEQRNKLQVRCSTRVQYTLAPDMMQPHLVDMRGNMKRETQALSTAIKNLIRGAAPQVVNISTNSWGR